MVKRKIRKWWRKIKKVAREVREFILITITAICAVGLFVIPFSFEIIYPSLILEFFLVWLGCFFWVAIFWYANGDKDEEQKNR